MTKISKSEAYKMIRLGHWLSLIFFVLNFLFSCRQEEHKNITIVWTNNRATAIAIPTFLFKNLSTDSLQKLLQIRLKSNPATMLGEYQTDGRRVLFTPVIPLSRGSRYEVFFRSNLIGNIDVPTDGTAKPARLVAIYPGLDTLPENLLKLYFEFSAPMRQGEALQHISLLSDNNDTLHDVFLDLQPELWNKERTILTLWLDPGRIKRDLIPNRKLGNPLQKGQRNRLNVSSKWQDIQGLPLPQTYNRNFVVGPRDSISPQIKLWTMVLPKSGTSQPLKVMTGEPLDYFLLQETIRIFDENKKTVNGIIKPVDKETGFLFTPKNKWRSGHYYMEVAHQLEDLAGNNLERLFDRDMLAPKPAIDKSVGEREFVIGLK